MIKEQRELSYQRGGREAVREFSETGTTITDRDLEFYKHLLGFSEEDLKDKRILDLGSGQFEKFSKEASKYGADVVSLNPELKRKDVREDVRKGVSGNIFTKLIERYHFGKWHGKSVAGRGQELPFAGQSFDRVFAVFSVPMYLPNPEREKQEWSQLFSEVLRVLTSRGKAIFYPISIEERELVPLENIILENGIEVEVKFDFIRDWPKHGWRLTLEKK